MCMLLRLQGNVHSYKYVGTGCYYSCSDTQGKVQAERYNQAGLIACSLSKKLHIPVDENYIIRVKKTTPMKET